MAGIKVYFPEDGATIRTNVVAATGRYKRPERVRGVLSSLTDETSYVGTPKALENKLWVLFFGRVQAEKTYLLHIFDVTDPTIHTDLTVKVDPSERSMKTNIIFPAANATLRDRNVVVVGATSATEITNVTIQHAGQADLTPTEPLPITPVATSWSASFTIPEEYPCPGVSPDYTVHVEDSDGAPDSENGDIKLDQATLCPIIAGAKKSKKKKDKKKKKKARSKK